MQLSVPRNHVSVINQNRFVRRHVYGKNRTKAIQEGLKAAGFNEKNMYVVSTLNEATTALGTVIKPGDTVLFENDLPDNYNE